MGDGRLPNLLVAGVPKAGTGSLHAYLTQHPDVCAGDEKEIGYLNYHNPLRHTGEIPPLSDYARHFAGCVDQRYLIDATPTYSYGGEPVISAARRLLDRPKVVISLRDPVDRLWSAYTFQRSLGNIARFGSFEQYVEVCERRRRDGVTPVPRDHLHGLHIGFYADYMPRWLDTFGDDIRVVFAEDLARRPEEITAELFGWLGLDPDTVRLNLQARNVTRSIRSQRAAKLVFSAKRGVDRVGLLHPAVRRPLRRAYERINAGRRTERLDPTLRRQLEEVYRSSNQETARALVAHGYDDLPAWLTAQPVSAGETGQASAEHLTTSADQPAHHGHAR